MVSQRAGAAEMLAGTGPFTIFAPTDQAFQGLGPGELDDLMKPQNQEKLRSLVLRHVTPGQITATDLMHTNTVQMANGKSYPIAASPGRITLGGRATVGQAIDGRNGVVYPLDEVLEP